MLSKKFRLRKLNKIIATSVLMGACLIFGQGHDASATGFRGVNSGASGSGAGRGRGIGTGTPGSSSNLGGSGRRNSIGTSSGGVSGSTSPGSPSSSGVRGASSSTSLSSGSSLLGSSGEARVQRLLNKIQEDIQTGNGPDYGTYKLLLDEVPNSTKYSGDGGVRHKYSSGGTSVEILVDKDGNLQSAFIDTRGDSGSASSSVRGTSSSTSLSSRGASLGNDKVKVQQLFEKIREDIEKENGFSNPGIYNDLLKEIPDFIGESSDGSLNYKYSLDGKIVEMAVDPKSGNVKSALVDMGGKGGFIDFQQGFSQIS